IDLATIASHQGALGEALARAMAALQQSPTSAMASELVADILGSSRWQVPEITLSHRLQVDHLQFAAPQTLWVSLSGPTNTLVRWNLETLKIESTLFPRSCQETRSLVIDPTHRALVIERGDVTLLCNANTLRPIRDLGSLPPALTPSATIAFSADGLLLAHPALTATPEPSIIWHLRDASSGEIIRSSEPDGPGTPRPLAAALDRQALRVLRHDGSLWTMPVSPVEGVTVTAPSEPASFLFARLADDGRSALALKDLGPHLAPIQQLVKLGPGPGDETSLDPAKLLESNPWTLQPSLWTGLGREFWPTVKISGHSAQVPSTNTFCAPSPITAAAFSGQHTFIGGRDGIVTIHRIIPAPEIIHATSAPAALDAAALSALANLTEALAGVTYDESTRQLVMATVPHRLLAFNHCDFVALRRVFPDLDFSSVMSAFQAVKPAPPAPEALIPLWDRLARADANGASWPTLLDKAQDLATTEWHQQLTAAVVARSSKGAVNPDASPWLAPLKIEKCFELGDSVAIESAIAGTGGNGPAAAKTLELALASTHPEWIEPLLARAVNLPPLLRQIAQSRVAWLQGRKADALAVWPDVFPDFAHVRSREDWDGWEQADFSQALNNLRLCVGEELATIEVPPNPTPEQRKAVAARLSDPATLQSVGRTRFATACLKAALAFAAFKEETSTTFTLAARARELGEAPAPCLRAEAMALTALGDYEKAHDRWISLITGFPVASQQPGDYAEAAYTSFENADPRQAMAVLTTGLHRFPNDSNFALRAGWVALLTGNAERAYRFLLNGNQIGYSPEKLENATALLAIAAQQSGATEDATAFYQDLILLDPAWKNTETLESLEWPEELKESLRQLVW
ncbi:MAG: hypothetical protein RLZZ282_1055, partial [Verrucomicrobiota bacterium]